MNIRRGGVLVGCVALALAGGGRPADEGPKKPGPVTVRLEKTAAGWALLRGGKPYLVKGVGGTGSLAALAAAGGNSVRTWGAENLGKVLDEAQRRGLTVTAGVWLGHERHGFHYNDADQVARQADAVRQVVLRYRNHPALLAWGLGNEMEGYGKGDNAAVWSAVNSLGAMVHKLDPHHPTLTVVAEIGGDRVKNLHRLCPEIDLVGINSYAGAATLARRYRAAGGVKPFLLTEFGPAGVWESPKNAWGVAAEPSSTQKAAAYRKAYEGAVGGGKGLCVGSYAFLWGHKQEATATWFGMLLPDGKRLAAVDAMTELWTGKPPANRCPAIESLTLAGPAEVEPGAMLRAVLRASDPEKDPLAVRWVLQGEAAALGAGGDAEQAPPTYPKAVVEGTPRGATVRAPKGGGVYRLFAYVSDDHGGAAVANVLLRVKGPVAVAPARKAALPLVVYDEATRKDLPYAPTGWMGNTKATKMDPAWAEGAKAGKTCVRIAYEDKDGWAGIVWQHPANDWGERPGGWDLSGAKKLTFWARGQAGDEVVSFEAGLLGKGKAFPDSAHVKLAGVRLTKGWKQYTLELKGKDLSRIKTGFSCTWSAAGRPVTFYLDEIRYE
jgi:hypothetical protein